MSAEEQPRIGGKPVETARVASPEKVLAFGLLDVIGELAGILVAKGIITATELQLVMEGRAKIVRDQWGDLQASPPKTMAEIAALWAKPHALAFPKDAKVIQFPKKDESARAAGDDESAPAGAA